MPKLNITHLTERLAKRIQQLEQGEEIAVRDINALLSTEQQQALKLAWAAQQALRKQHKQPKTAAEKEQLGWKTIREVRLDIYRQALQDAQASLVDGIKELHHKSEVRAARVFMDAFNKAHKEGKNAHSAGNIALTRAGFNTKSRVSKRDKEINEMEDALLKKLKQ